MHALVRTRFAALALMSVVALAGCGKPGSEATDSDTEALAADGNEAITSSSQSSSFGQVVFSAISSQSPSEAVSELAGPTALWPAGCVTKARDATNPLVVHVTFDECSGPFGLVHLSGAETVTFSQGASGALHADFQSEGLTANGRPLTHSASADISVSGSQRSITYDGAYTRETKAGVTVSHTSKLTLLLDLSAKCLTANGAAQTDIGTTEIDSTIDNYKLCEQGGVVECPTGTVTHTAKASGRSITVDYDGTNNAQVTSSNGNTSDVTLACGQSG